MSKKDYVELSKKWFDNQAPVYDEKDVILYSKYGKISCQNICNYLKDKEVLKYLDVVVDGQFVDEEKNPTLEWKGSSNQRVIDVQESLKENKTILK